MTNRIRPPSAAERLVPATPEVAPDAMAAPRSVTPERPSAGATPALREWFRRDGLHGEPMPGAAGFAAAHFRFALNDSPVVFEDESRTAARKVRAKREAWEERIRELRSYAAEDGDPFRLESEQDFWAFVETRPSVRKGGLVLVDSGELRAVWQGDPGTRVGVEFLGGRVLRFVIFKRDPSTGEVARIAGYDDFDGFERQIDAFDLDSLVFE